MAHEINNPLAIIDQKSGLIQNLLGHTEDVKYKENSIPPSQLQQIFLNINAIDAIGKDGAIAISNKPQGRDVMW